MIKKIALAAVFALVSVVSFTSSQVNASPTQPSSFGAPVMNGIKCAAGRC